MLFKDFAQILYNNCASETTEYQFFLLLFDMLMYSPEASSEKLPDQDKKGNPFDKLKPDTIERLFRGGTLNPKTLRIVYQKKSPDKFANYINGFGERKGLEIESDIKKHLPRFNSEEGDIGYACADLFINIIRELIEGNIPGSSNLATSSLTADDIRGLIYYDPMDNKIHIDNHEIQLPPQLIPPNDISNEESIYITKLLNAYAQANGVSQITIADIDTLNRRYKDNFEEQRINYYSAVRISRILRESFSNGEAELNTWISETYDYISDILRDDCYANGYRRLVEVLKTVINSKTTSIVDQCERLVGSKERKGVCHLLANDGTIDWTDDYE